jgi:hypothetical protein
MPRGVRTAHSTDDFENGSADDGDYASLDWTQLRVTAVAPQIEVAPAREFGDDKLAYEKFMQDLVVIRLTEPTDENAPTHAMVGSNGEQLWLPRGPVLRIPRRFVENLAHSQSTRVSTKMNHDPNKDDAMDVRRTTTPDYPFAVLQDPAGQKGREWLRRVVREAC